MPLAEPRSPRRAPPCNPPSNQLTCITPRGPLIIGSRVSFGYATEGAVNRLAGDARPLRRHILPGQPTSLGQGENPDRR
jgi:hypothetical protein